MIKTESEAEKATLERNFNLAQGLMFGAQYDNDKQAIMKPLGVFQEKSIEYASQRTIFADARTARSIFSSSVLTFLMVVVVTSIFLIITKKLASLKNLDHKMQELASAGGDLKGQTHQKGSCVLQKYGVSSKRIAIPKIDRSG